MKKIYFIFLIITIAFLFYPLSINRGVGSTNDVDIWWPIANFPMKGSQPFKAVIYGRELASYRMFWQVDNGQWNSMENNYISYPNKEVLVDLTNWNWNTSQQYSVNFIATDTKGTILSQKSVTIVVDQEKIYEPINAVLTGGNPPPAPTPPPPIQTMNKTSLYVNPYSNALSWAKNNAVTQPANAQLMQKIGDQPVALWFGGWDNDIQTDVARVVADAASKNTVPVLVAYDIPSRDCNGYSAGGVAASSDYQRWIGKFSQGIGNNKAIVILEPDSIAGISCLSTTQQRERFSLLASAVQTLKKSPNVTVYIDGGNAHWIDAKTMATRLSRSGITIADGFAINVSNFFTNEDSLAYGQKLSALAGGKHFVIDTSRNGNGPTTDSQWCNPQGRALGTQPTTTTGINLLDAYLWIKNPTESDGTCNGGPTAGTFWLEYALALAQNARW